MRSLGSFKFHVLRYGFLVVAIAFGWELQSAQSQIPPRAQVPVAIAGQPFGVLTVEVPLPPDWDGRPPRVLVKEQSGNLFYPVVAIRNGERKADNQPPRIGRPGGLIDRVRNAIRSDDDTRQVPEAIQVFGLFRGSDPVKIVLTGDINQQIVFTVDQGRNATHPKLLQQWWDAYVQNAKNEVSNEGAPKLVQYYLTSMLAARLNLASVDIDPPKAEADSSEKNQPLETLALLAAIEPLREQILENVLRVPQSKSPEIPVPPEPLWEPKASPPADPSIAVERIATVIPPECFYLRFGSFNNYVWFQELAERFGGDITQAIFLRGFNYEASARLERMLGTKLTVIAKMFGDKLISDLALFGSDLYMKEGASVGVVFQASNPALLKASIEKERRAVLSRNPDARIQDMVINGVNVSLLGTPDNRIRSFMVTHDAYVLISTSQHLVQRFLEVAQGEPSLASTNHFRLTRGWMQEQNNYSVFGYFSPDFFHRLVSPQYQIELRRRLEAVAHLEVAEISGLAAAAEGIPFESLAQLQQAQLLPAWFDQRPDGSRVLRSRDRLVDAVRGARGSFLPIADVKISNVTEKEAEEYAQVAEFYQTKWQRMDPLVLGIRRFKADDGTGETVAVEAHVSPFEPKKYGWIAEQLADPNPIEIKLPKDDAASVQFHVRGKNPGESYFLFGGLKDMMPPESEDVKGLLQVLRVLKSTPAYIGAWPKPDLIEQLPLGLGSALGRPDINGFARMIGGLWRWQNEQWSLLSFDRQILDSAIPHLGTFETPEHAQARATVSNLQGSKLESWVNTLWWQRGWQSSHGNADLLDNLHQQFKIPVEHCLNTANQLLDVKLQCPLGGNFELDDAGETNGQGWWISSAWQASTASPRGKALPPAEYKAPWIEWFRGAKVQATQQSSSLSVVGTIHLDLPPPSVVVEEENSPALSSLKALNIFSLPQMIFGLEKNSESKPPTKKSF